VPGKIKFGRPKPRGILLSALLPFLAFNGKGQVMTDAQFSLLQRELRFIQLILVVMVVLLAVIAGLPQPP
jgi:hypothetical protein